MEQVPGANLSADTVKAGRNLDEVVATLLRNFGAGSDYFKVVLPLLVVPLLPLVLVVLLVVLPVVVLVVLAVHGLSTFHVSVSFTALPHQPCPLLSLVRCWSRCFRRCCWTRRTTTTSRPST